MNSGRQAEPADPLHPQCLTSSLEFRCTSTPSPSPEHRWGASSELMEFKAEMTLSTLNCQVRLVLHQEPANSKPNPSAVMTKQRALRILLSWVYGLKNVNLLHNYIPTILFKKLGFISYHLNEIVREQCYFWEGLMWVTWVTERFLIIFMNNWGFLANGQI